MSATRDQVALAQAQGALAEQGQINDRLAKAVEQIDRQGPDHLQSRLGGVYALKHIARDSPRHQPTIIDILSAFVRTTTPKPDAEDNCPASGPAADIQAALTILGSRDPVHDGGARINLWGSCLVLTDLSHSNFVEANLRGANLIGADLRSSDLHDADLSGTDLSGRIVDGDPTNPPLASGFRQGQDPSMQSGATIAFASLEGVTLIGADLTGSSLGHCNLIGVDLRGADLSGAHLVGARLGSANLTKANLSTADLTGAALGDAHLSETDLASSMLKDAYLVAANLTNADLIDAELSGAYLGRANLTKANLMGANLVGTYHNDSTIVTGAKTDSATRGKWW